MNFCRACQREHAGPECPIDEQGRPSPPANIEPRQPSAAGWTWMATAATTANTSAPLSSLVNITFVTGAQRPPDDDGLAGVPALVR